MKSTELAYELGLLFDKKITSYYRNTYKGVLGQVQVQVLNDLYANRIVKPQDIADRMTIPKQHASKILSRLEALGYVQHSIDPKDRRGRLYTLTKAGTELMQEHISVSNTHFEAMLGQLDNSELQQMSDAMETMVKLLNKL